MTWPTTVPILEPCDIAPSNSRWDVPKRLICYMVSTFSLPEVERVQGAFALVHYLLIRMEIPIDQLLIWNVTMSALGYTEGQSSQTLQILKSIKENYASQSKQLSDYTDNI